MSEIVDDVLCGLSCSWCSVYFCKENGDKSYGGNEPSICSDCFKQYRKEKRVGKKQAVRMLRALGLQVCKLPS